MNNFEKKETKKTIKKDWCPFDQQEGRCIKERCMLYVIDNDYFNGCAFAAIARSLGLIARRGAY